MRPSKISQSNLDNGRIFLYGEINDRLARAVSEKLRYLVFEKKLKTIYLFINSGGGDYESGCGIVDELLGFEKLGITIYTIAIGRAESAAADILAVGTERYATANVIIMMHPVQYSADSDKLSRIKCDTDFTHKHYSAYVELIAKKCKYTTKSKIAEFVKRVEDTLWLTAKEAIKFGIIDDIWDYNYEVEKE